MPELASDVAKVGMVLRRGAATAGVVTWEEGIPRVATTAADSVIGWPETTTAADSVVGWPETTTAAVVGWPEAMTG